MNSTNDQIKHLDATDGKPLLYAGTQNQQKLKLKHEKNFY